MGEQHSVHVTVLFDEYSMGGAFDAPMQNTTYMYMQCTCVYIYM